MTGLLRFQSLLLFLFVMAAVFVGLAVTGQTGWLPWLTGLALMTVMTSFYFTGRRGKDTGAVADRGQTTLPDIGIGKLIDAMPDPCVLLDRRGAVFCFNAKAAQLFPGLAINTPLTFHIRWPGLHAAIDKALVGETLSVEIEDKVPIERWHTVFVAPLKQGEAGSDYICVTIHDRTNQMRAERMRVDFVANASHELRTPLASLLGFVETLQGAAKDDEKNRTRFLGIMQQQAQRMSRLIDDLLSLSRIEMHAHIQPDTPLELGGLIRSTMDALRPLAEDRGVSLSIDEPEQELIVLGDRDELIRAFENLIENAIKYGESGKKVDVAITPSVKPDGMVRVDIRDYGLGIAEDQLPRLTERFYRVDEASSREKGGTGLGLAIVKHILTRHRGQLGIKSQPGQGSVFTALLPLSAKP